MPEISEVQGQYIILSEDGEQFGPYDEKKKAAAKYRELQRESGDRSSMNNQSQSKGQQLATRFAQGVNKAASRAGDAGRNLAQTADQKAQEAADKRFDEEEQEEEQGGPTLDSLFGGGGMNEEQDGGPSLEMFGGGGGGAQLPFAQSDDEEQQGGPSLDFLGGGGGGGGDAPQLPGFGPPAEDGEEPQSPMMMGQGPDMGDLPFGRQTEEDTDGDEGDVDPLRFF